MTLIEELEQASEGSRDLDIAIRFETIGDVARCNYDEFSWCSDEDCECPGCGKWLGMHDKRGSYPARWQDDKRLPHYTTNLQDALELVPEGWNWHLITEFDGINAAVWPPGNAEDFPEITAPTPALALCIAALKARNRV